ncbi:hypothetical protein XENOCAPTIV_030821 [Xenoophorus captivus]|uniref:Secreted protein n=1 Tax=Xenoophorus captivus TaxID=1517983 RepID=A0ABV0Q722_9TELE
MGRTACLFVFAVILLSDALQSNLSSQFRRPNLCAAFLLVFCKFLFGHNSWAKIRTFFDLTFFLNSSRNAVGRFFFREAEERCNHRRMKPIKMVQTSSSTRGKKDEWILPEYF